MTHRRKQRVAMALWLALAVAAAAAWFLTRPTAPAASRFRKAAPVVNRRNLVDQKPLETARALTAQAWTREERPPAWRALKISDDAVDLAFAIALRDAEIHPPPPTEQTRQIQARLKQGETAVIADQDTIAALQESKSKNDPEVQ